MRIAKEEVERQEVQPRFSWLNVLFLGVLVCLLGTGFFVYNQIYKQHINSEMTRLVVNILPLPAGSVNGDTFFYKEVFAFDILAQIEEPERDSFGAAVDAIVRQMLVEQIADELDILIDSVEAGEDQWSQYGWTQEQYIDYVLQPMTLAAAVDEALLYSQDHQQDIVDELEHVIELYESGISFDDLAVQYSENSKAQFGGDEGETCFEVGEQELTGEWSKSVGVISEVMEVDDSYAVAVAYGIRDEGEICTWVGVQAIQIYKNSLADILPERKESAEVIIFGQ